MKFRVNISPVSEILDLYESGKLVLSPHYQRNEIWSTNLKQELIDSIKRNYPIPALFLYTQPDGSIQVVDGQQRIRSILGYTQGIFKDKEGSAFAPLIDKAFLNYALTVVYLEEVEDEDEVVEIYRRLNKFGLPLNRPELIKAEYYDTNFYKLAVNLSGSKVFLELDLFRDSSKNRLNHVEFVTELLALIEFGISEKKSKVDQLYESDINDEQINRIKDEFNSVFYIINNLNDIFRIKDTRYKQRNDFYTLFNFILFNIKSSQEFWEKVYSNLLFFEEDIRPSNEDIDLFQVYAYYCVTQSNSKNAREKRIDFYNHLFLNESGEMNEWQKQVSEYYNEKEIELETINVDGKILFDCEI